MNFEEKLDTVLKEIGQVHNLSPGELNMLRRNITTRYNMYKSIKPNINHQETSFIKNTSDVGDVLINRLINNIRTYKISREYNPNIQVKGSYISKNQEFNLESPASIKAATMRKLRERVPNVSDELLQRTVIKVFDHETGHALQRSFSGYSGYRDSKFNELIKNLTEKYPETFENTNTGKLETLQAGMFPQRREDSRSQMRKFYSNIAFGTHLDEIFNDTESLAMAGKQEPQFQYNHGNGIKQNIYAYESSNYRITAYGEMMKSLMGKERTYRSMYEDSILTYEFFDQFMEESNTAFANSRYAGKPPMLNVLNALDEARNKKSVSASLELDLFFTKVLEKKVAHELRNPNLQMSNINELVGMIKTFDSRILKSDDHRLASERVIDNLKKRVEEKYNELKNRDKSKEQVHSEKVQTQEKLSVENHEETKKVPSKEPFDKKNINEIYQKIYELLEENKGKNLSPDAKKKFVGEFFYYEGYLMNAIESERQVQELLTRVVNDFGSSNMERTLQENILSDLQERYTEIKGKVEENQIPKDSQRDYSDIRKQLVSISSRYREMISDGLIDDIELNELIIKINTLEKEVLKQEQDAKNVKEKQVLEEISESIYNEKRKMEKMQMGIERINDTFDLSKKNAI